VLAPGMQLHELLDKAYHYQYYLLILVCYLISKIKLRGHLAQKYLEMIYFSFHRSLNLSDEDLKKLAHLQAIAVHPHFRGYGLQRKLAAAHLKVLERTGYEHICCTVSPKNPVSLNNLLSYKNWPMTGAGIAVTGDETAITCLNIERQRELIRRGYEGYRVEGNGEKSEIFYRKRSTPAMDSLSRIIS